MLHSICTPVKNRTPHLRSTYIHNIEEGLRAANNLEFILIDLDSNDGMHEWVKTTLRPYVEDGTVKYYRAIGPWPIWNCSQAFNVGMLTGTGDLLTNLHADNLMSAAAYKEHQRLSANGDIVISPAIATGGKTKHFTGSCGLVTLTKTQFLDIGGYDERMIGWGYQDLDFADRMKLLGHKWVPWTAETVSGIDHGHDLRAAHTEVPAHAGNLHNHKLSKEAIKAGQLRANAGKPWGDVPIERVTKL